MNQLEKAIFWVGLVVVVVDNIGWQWATKLATEPLWGGDIYKGWSMAWDIILLVVWVYVLIRIYKRVNRKD